VTGGQEVQIVHGSFTAGTPVEQKAVQGMAAEGVKPAPADILTNEVHPRTGPPPPEGANVANALVADFSKPGRIVIFDPATRRVVWEYEGKSGERMLDHPSLARELPGTRDVIVADDWRERVVVIDGKTKDIIWQYGVTDRRGHVPGYLNYPDGFDLDVFYDWKKVHGRKL
jgi:hypothetical protein